MPDSMNRAFSLVLACVIAASISAQGTVELTPSKDNTLYQSSNGSLSNGAGTGFFCGVTSMNLKRRGLVAFDVAGNLPAGATVLSASLTLEMNQNASGSLAVDLRRVLADWGEGTSAPATGNGGSGAPATAGSATWVHRFYPNVQWAAAGGDFSPVASATLAVWNYGFYTWSTSQMAADVQGWLDNPATNFGWMLKCPETAVGNSKRFATKEEIFPNVWPKLSITYAASPAAAAANLGYGCAAGQLAAVGVPTVGNSSFALDLTAGPPGASAYVIVSSGPAPFSIGLGGACFLDLEPVSALANFSGGLYLGPVVVNGAGHASFPVGIPPVGGLHGLSFAVQCVTLGAVLASSNVLGLVIGS
jgi:hypothetical protein